MNTILNKIQRAGLSLLVAICVASVITMVGNAAGPYTRTEANTYRDPMGGTQTIQTVSSTKCQGSSCKYLTQPGPTENPTFYDWNMGDVANIYDWCAYIPTIGQAAVIYYVSETYNGNRRYWSQLLNQANALNQGKFVYIGFSDYPSQGDTTKFIQLRNTCQSGYSCAGLKVYFDTIKYTTYPTRLNQSTCQ